MKIKKTKTYVFNEDEFLALLKLKGISVAYMCWKPTARVIEIEVDN